jgi:actin-related protein
MKTMSVNLNSFQLAKILRDKLGEEQAEAVVTYIEEKVQEEFETKKEILATKKDISDLSEKLSEKMSSHFKWLIGMFITQMAFIIALVYFVLNYTK